MASLYRYQERVHDALMRGRNVILQAPTGAGKTRAALYPFLENLERHDDVDLPHSAPLPLTCRYAVPMRVLANQFEREYREYFPRLDERRGTRLLDRYRAKLGIRVPAIQTGETPDDRRFESPLTFCTIDQLLSSFIGTPYSLGTRQANLNVGAVAGSYLVLDEFHLYPLDGAGGARTTTLAMLRLLSGFCRFVLMTATFSTELLNTLAAELDADVVRVTDEKDIHEIMGTRSRTVRLSPIAMTPKAIIAAHDRARERGAPASLVICNTVARAQVMYSSLKAQLAESGRLEHTRLELLHSRFTTKDRRAKRIRLEWWMGKRRWREGRFLGPDTIVVATQVMEVGLNISAAVLHTELAPANSLIQRAGRCARFAGQHGEVVVYHPLAPADAKVDSRPLADLGALEQAEKGKRAANRPYLPYDRTESEATWKKLAADFEANESAAVPFGFREEQTLIDKVHTDSDRRMIEQFRGTNVQIEDAIRDALRTHEFERGASLIRDVTNVSLLIHDAPDQEITTRPFDWDAFALRPGTLMGAWDRLCERKEALDLRWVMKKLVSDEREPAEDDNSREAHYRWVDVRQEAHQTEINGALRLALPSALATYDSELGFRLLLDEDQNAKEGRSKDERKDERKKEGPKSFGGKQGSYVEHIRGLMGAYDWSVRRELAWVADRLERDMSLPAGSIDEAVRLAIACHDIGKLTQDWQHWAHMWQAKLVERHDLAYAVKPGNEFLAKTDRLDNWHEETAIQREMRTKGIPRPNHACAGVVAARALIDSQLVSRLTNDSDEAVDAMRALLRATFSAIARHHAPTAMEYASAVWDTAARDVIAEAFAACRLTPDLKQLQLEAVPADKLSSDDLVTPGFDSTRSRRATWLAFVIVRALRLCDQRAEKDWE